MAESTVFRPRSAGLGLGMIALPLLSLITVLLGVVAVLELSPMVGLSIFIACQVLALGPLLLLARLLLGIFALQVGPDALVVVGRYGASSVPFAWDDLQAVGLVDRHGNQMLAVQPMKPFSRPPKRALVKDGDLLVITGLDNWSAPRDEILSCIRRHAGDLWLDRLAQTTRQ